MSIAPPTPELPGGIITFFLAAPEGGKPGHDMTPDAHPLEVRETLRLVGQVIATHGGVPFASRAAIFCAAFSDPRAALAAAVAVQRALSSPASLSSWTIALHTGAAQSYGGAYIAPALSHAAYLLIAGHPGQIVVSVTTQRAVREQLPSEVELRGLGQARLRDLLRAEQLFDVLAPGLPAHFPPLETLDTWPQNLPVQSSTLVGRSEQVRRIVALLNGDDGRLITLHGPGGTGKTRLSLQVGAELLPECPDGVYFVPLATVTDPGLMSATIAQAVGIREMLGYPLNMSLQEYLADKSLLLILDNFEQLIEASTLVADLLTSCARLRMLVSSRILLHVPGEQRYAVAPLALPARLAGSLAELVLSPAVTLFMHRAQSVQPTFTLSAETAPAVAEICTRLDGLPLAIELAAARIKTLSPVELLTGLSSRLTMLTGGSRHLDERQQTLRGLIDWSYTLLSGGEQALFARLSVFAGGWTAHSAAAVCSIDDDLPFAMEEGLASLVDKSLVLHNEPREDDDGDGRYTMLETIREYAIHALERLAAVDDSASMHRQHAVYFLGLAEQAEPELTGPHQDIWLTRLETEHDNLRAALRWSRVNGRIDWGLRLAGALWRFWWVRGHLSEGQRWLQDLLDMSSEVSVDPGAATPQLEVPDDEESQVARAKALHGLGVFIHYQGHYIRAEALYEQSLQLWRRLGDKKGIAQSLSNLGALAHEQGRYARAMVLHEESLVLRRALGDDKGIAGSLVNLGIVAMYLHDYDRAASLYAEGLLLRRQLGDKRGVAVALNNLGDLARRRNDATQAAAHLAESLSLFSLLGDKVYVATLLEGIAGVAVMAGHATRAAQLFGSAAALRNAIGAPLLPIDSAAYDSDVAADRAALTAEQFAQAWADGEAMTLEQAIAYALETANLA